MNSMPGKLYKFSPDSSFIKLLPKTRFLQIETFGKVKRNVADLCLLAGYDLKRFKKTRMTHYMEDDSGVRLPKTYQSAVDTIRLTIKRGFDFIHIVRLQNFDNLKYLIIKFKATAKVISGFTDALLLDTVEYLEIKDYQDVDNQHGKPYLIYKVFPKLTSLKLTNCVVTPMWLNYLPPELQKLTIDCCQVSNSYPNDKMIFKTSHMHSLKKLKNKMLSKKADSKPLAKYYLKVLLPISLKRIEVSSNSGTGLQRQQYPYSLSQVFDSVYDLNFELFKASKRSQYHIDSFRLR